MVQVSCNALWNLSPYFLGVLEEIVDSSIFNQKTINVACIMMALLEMKIASILVYNVQKVRCIWMFIPGEILALCTNLFFVFPKFWHELQIYPRPLNFFLWKKISKETNRQTWKFYFSHICRSICDPKYTFPKQQKLILRDAVFLSICFIL